MPGLRVSLVCREDQLADFGVQAGRRGVNWLAAPGSVRGLPARLGYSMGMVPILAARHCATVLLCPTDYSPPLSPCPVVLMIRNPTPYIRDMGGAATFRRRVRESAMRQTTLLCSWRADRIILVSRAALDATAAVIPLPEDRVRVVHHGRDPRFRPPPPGAQRNLDLVLSVSSIYYFKNYPVLLDAMSILRSRHGLRPRLKIAGAPFDPAHAEYLKQRCRALSLEDQVEFLGEVPHARLVEIYQSAGIFVMPSRLETFGHPYIESMATGTAAIVGDIPCAREMCGEAVRYAHPDDPAAFAAGMAELLTNEGARRELEARGPAQAAHFGWDRCARETMQVMREAEQSGRRGR